MAVQISKETIAEELAREQRWDWLRYPGYALLFALFLLLLLVVWFWPRYPYNPAVDLPWEVERVNLMPLVEGVAKERGYFNINGPTVIRVPDWVKNPLGRYYMYFAHHKGSYIRLAYADHPEGPWRVHRRQVMPLETSGFPVQMPRISEGALDRLYDTFSLHVVRDYLLLQYQAVVADPAERKRRGFSEAANRMTHVASPEIWIDELGKRLVMFYHGYDELGSQSSRIATSTDGLDFTPTGGTVFSTYLRAFEYRGQFYLLGMPGVLYRANSAEGPFKPRRRLLFQPDMRHAGLWLEGDTLHVFWSVVGYAPERILYSQVDLSSWDWDDWRATTPAEVLAPELKWEGVEVPVMPSLRGELDILAHELRDPYLFVDEDGERYLYYVGGGEKAIGMVRLRDKPEDM